MQVPNGRPGRRDSTGQLRRGRRIEPDLADLLRSAGYAVQWVNVYRADILEQLRGCIGFM